MVKILVAEETPWLRDFYCNELASREHQVLACGDHEELLSNLTRWQPQVVLLDSSLCHKTGKELLIRIQGQSKRPPAIVLMVFSCAQAERFAAQIDDYALKDISIPALRQKIRRVLDKAAREG